ncbi:MAG: hypothetical protein M0026_10170 [Nocardiopsaceae bacterium]|nr:hypothetical protein [Nocardiopsaceae bacterium]
MTIALVIAGVAVLLAGTRWGLSRYLTAQRVYPRPNEHMADLVAQAERSLKRSEDSGAYLGHLWAWRDLLADTAEEKSRTPSEGGTATFSETQRREFDEVAERIRASLADLDPNRFED